MRALAVLLCVLLLGAGGAWFGARYLYDAPGPLPATRDVLVHHGDSAVVAASLQRGGVVQPGRWGRLAFQVAARLTRGDGALHAAEFAFPVHASLRETLSILRHAHPVQHPLTVPEGLTATQIASLLRAAPFLAGDVPAIAEGSVLPQTISYEYGTSRAKLVARLQGMMTVALAKVWAEREPDPSLPDPQALLTLASMVERETATAAERPLVARVFLNRLRDHMRLQSDPTVIYAVTHRAQTGGTLTDDAGGRAALTHADLSFVSPYNTYTVEGLPPGPICSPGLASLEAAAHPARSAAEYFVANGSGATSFATTLDAHNRNVALRRQGGK
jgi:UPF0755 protein